MPMQRCFSMSNLNDWRIIADASPSMLRPRVHTATEWPPDYDAIYRWRANTLSRLRADPTLLASSLTYYESRPAEFIMDWMDTYDPRNAERKWMPFVFFPKQRDLVDFLESCDNDQQSGIIEKARDMGATWVCCAYTLWRWLFIKSDAVGWGSRKQDLVDRIGDPDSIFEKLRLLRKRLPDVFQPKGFNEARHDNFMKLTNPQTGAITSGEAGDNVGRGGRKSMWVKDEAQPLTSQILTPFGWKTMGEIKPGMLIIGVDGKAQIVTHTNSCGEHQVYRVEFTDGTSCEVSENHLWSVENMIGVRKKFTLSTVEISKNLRYCTPDNEVQYRYSIPTTAPVEFLSGELPLHPYVVGALLGDGSLGSVPHHSPKITTIDIEIINQFRELLPSWCTISQEKERITWRLGDIRGRQGWKHKSRIRQIIVDIGIAGKRSWEKTIPNDYKFSSVNNRIALLQGLLDTDGSAANGGSISFHSSSKTLAEDVRFLTQSLGGTATLNIKKDKRGYRDQYVLHLVLPVNIAPFRLKRKLNALRKRKHASDKRIRKIEPLGKMQVKCISVSNIDGLYLTDNCIVTHNSAHYERPEKIEAAVGDSTNVQIDISSVNGLGNVFQRRAENAILWERGKLIAKGYVRKFIMDWRDHPLKTQEWYDTRKAKYEREGMAHIFAQEVDRDYSGAVSNTVIPYEWIRAAVDAHIHVPFIAAAYAVNRGLYYYGGLDVADEGTDRNAWTLREWIIWRESIEWGSRDPAVSARMAIQRAQPYRGRIEVEYDCVGVGAGVKGEYNRLTQDEGLNDIPFIPWNAGAGVLQPRARMIVDDDESPMNKDFFDNLKAQAWWALRTRFYKTWKARTTGEIYPADECISLDGTMTALDQVCKELAQPTHKPSGRLKMMIEKKPKGTKSPNMADSGMQAFFPVPSDSYEVQVGNYGHKA